MTGENTVVPPAVIVAVSVRFTKLVAVVVTVCAPPGAPLIEYSPVELVVADRVPTLTIAPTIASPSLGVVTRPLNVPTVTGGGAGAWGVGVGGVGADGLGSDPPHARASIEPPMRTRFQ
jgi:hypothetical protein